ncbi:MAG: hypothetical protein RRB13_12790 [bacterium]|nr:hypothetical protein [bacterium]
MRPLTPLRTLPPAQGFKQGDVFVLFGELFSRGYANGLVDEAKAAGMTLIGITVGRRDKENQLRPLTPEELSEAEANLGGKILNYPLWAGFDMDPCSTGTQPAEMIAGVKPNEWEDFKLDWTLVEEARQEGFRRFRETAALMAAELKGLIPQGANVFFSHTMAGGIPKAKIFLVLINRAIKGTGARYLSSKGLWESDLGRLASLNYDAVSADSFKDLLDATASIREMVSGWGGQCVYTGYGYHGTEILIQGQYRWQTYTPYLPGWAKKKLEDYAAQARQEGIRATIFNCPEIRTNSSDLFSGVELSLYPLLAALEKEGGGAWVQQQREICAAKLTPDMNLEEMMAAVDAYHLDPIVTEFYQDFENWPRHNTAELAELMVGTSDRLMAYNADKKDLVTDHLSELVVQSSGRLMFRLAVSTEEPVLFLGHDIIAKDLLKAQPECTPWR